MLITNLTKSNISKYIHDLKADHGGRGKKFTATIF